MKFVCLILFSLSFCQTVFARSGALTAEELAAVISWSSRKADPISGYASNPGALLTPPVGSVPKQTRAVQKYIEKIVERLAGEEIRKRGLNIVVNIYAWDTDNAWARQFSPQFGYEKAWLEKNPKVVWPVRRLLGFGGNNEPIYEVAVTTGFLRLMKYDAELAWVIAHELTHILEGQTFPDKTGAEDERPPADRIREGISHWFHSQSNEAVADRGGTNISIGKFGIDGAILALRKLLEQVPGEHKVEEAWKTAIYQAAASHHDEGLRLTLSQMYREYLRRTNQDAAPVPLNKTPAFTQMKNPDRGYLPSYLNAEEQARFVHVIDNYFLAGKNYEFLTTFAPLGRMVSGPQYRWYPDQLYDILKRGQNDPKVVHQMFTIALKRIEESTASGAQKVNAMLFSLALLTRLCGDEMIGPMLDGLTQAESARFLHFLAKNSVEGKWNYDSFAAQMSTLRKQRDQFSRPYGVLEDMLMTSEKGQEILSTLMRSIPAWRGYFAHFADLDIWGEPSQSEGIALMQMKLMTANHYPHGVLYGEHIRQLTANLAKVDAVTLAVNADSTEGGYDFFIRVVDHFKKVVAKELPNERGAKLIEDGFNSIYVRNRLSEVLHAMTGESRPEDQQIENAAIARRFRFLQTLQTLIQLGVVDARRPDVLEAYKTFVHLAATNISFGPEENPFLAVGPGIVDMTAAIVSDPRVAKSRKVEAIKVLAALNGYRSDFFIYGYPREAQVRREFSDFLATLSKDELLGLISQDLESLLREVKVQEDWKKSQPPLDAFGRRNFWRASDYFLGNSFGVIGLMASMSSTQVLSQLTYKDVRGLIVDLNRKHGRALLLIANRGELAQIKKSFHYRYEIANELMKLVVDKRGEAPSFSDWYDTYQRAMDFTGAVFVLPESHLSIARAYVESSLLSMSVSSRMQWLRQKNIRQIVSNEFMAKTLAEGVRLAVSNPKDREQVRMQIERMNRVYNLVDGHPDANAIFRNQITKIFQVQPREVDKFFPEDKRSATERANGISGEVRGLSGLLAMTRVQSAAAQIQMIEYLAGRRAAVPDFFREQDIYMRSSDSIGNFFHNGIVPPLDHAAQVLRNNIYSRGPLERTLIISSFLAGPNSFIEKPEGLKALLDHLLSSVKPENQEFARRLAEGLMKAEGIHKSFILGFILSQKPEGNNVKLSEAAVLQGFMQFYGVPGIKLVQYLGFAEEFKDYNEIFAVYQDEALPLNEFEVAKLIQTQIGEAWDPVRYKYLGIQGSGSVNIGVRYQDLQTGESRVVTVLRENIETKTKEDFRRFRALIGALLEEPGGREKYEFVLGLLDIIEKSVALEFDKAHAMRMQKLAAEFYNRDVDGWKVRTVTPYEALEKGLFMSLAPGQTGRKILEKNPELYRSAMKALLKIEDEMLRGLDARQISKPLPLFANPDLHDGQVLIDENARQVTIIDFGQALPLSNQERELGIALLRVASKVDSAAKSYMILQEFSAKMGQHKFSLNWEKFKKVMNRGERMDVFVHLVSLLQLSGFDVPLSSVHWVLGVNRAVVLGGKVGVSLESRYRDLLLSQKAGLDLGTYNAARALWGSAANWVQQISGGGAAASVASCAQGLRPKFP